MHITISQCPNTHTSTPSILPSNNAKKIEEHKSSYSIPSIKIKSKDQYTQETIPFKHPGKGII